MSPPAAGEEEFWLSEESRFRPNLLILRMPVSHWALLLKEGVPGIVMMSTTHRSQEKKIVTNNEVRTFAFRRLSLHGMPPTRQAGPCIILGSGLVLNSIARCGAHHDARYEGYPASCFAASRLHAPRRVPSYHAGKPHLKGVHHVAGSATHAIAELLCATGTLTCEPQSRSRLQQARGRRGCCVRPP